MQLQVKILKLKQFTLLLKPSNKLKGEVNSCLNKSCDILRCTIILPSFLHNLSLNNDNFEIMEIHENYLLRTLTL